MCRYASFFAYLVALVASLISLYFSEILGYEACKYCWTQRVFLFPLPILLFFLIFFKRSDIAIFLLPLPLLGMVAALYHIMMNVAYCEGCGGISWTPIGSLAAFSLITFFLLLSLTPIREIE